MKIIDQTPYYKDGVLSLMDRGRAIIKYGTGWSKEIEAQIPVIATLEKNLDKKFTLLRNVTPTGLNATIPLILVGPSGVYVMCVTNLTGTLTARADQWGTITGDTFKPEIPNLLTRTERMARAIQVFLQRQGYNDLLMAEPVLICSDPTTHVDTIRPIIRVIMRDTVERFAVSVAQARVVLSAESVYDIVKLILNPPVVQPKPVEAAPVQAAETSAPQAAGGSGLPAQPQVAPPPAATPLQEAGMPEEPAPRRRLAISRRQWVLLIGMFVIWCLIVAVIAFLIARDFFQFLPTP